MEKNLEYLIKTCKYKDNELDDIMKIKGSDKSTRHTYTKIYSHLFPDRTKNIKLLEVGIGSQNPNFKYTMGSEYTVGGSLYGWKEWFTNGEIYGADIDESALFETERIKTFQLDQTNHESIKKTMEKIGKVDIIIDDGLHEADANDTLCKNSREFLNEGGIYIIEDIQPHDLEKHTKNIEEYKKYFKYVEMVHVPGGSEDNILILMEK